MIRLSRRAALSAGVAAMVAPMLAARRAPAQDRYPSRYVKLVVPWPPGGITDMTGRILAQYLSGELGQSVVVENRAGAAGTVGHASVAQAPADGYTLLLATNSTYAIAPHLFERLPYDSEKAFAPISLICQSPQMLCAHPSVPAKNFPAFLEYLRARQPDGVLYGSSGPGASSHLAAELMMSMAQARMVHVPYRGGGPAMQGLLAGDVNVGFVDAVIALPQASAGKLVMLGVSTTTRSALAPDVLTIDEAGLPGFQSSTDVAFLTVAGTPEPIIRRLHAAVVAALRSPQVREPLLAQGAILIGGSPEEFETYVAQESAKWREVIRSRGIKMSQ